MTIWYSIGGGVERDKREGGRERTRDKRMTTTTGHNRRQRAAHCKYGIGDEFHHSTRLLNFKHLKTFIFDSPSFVDYWRNLKKCDDFRVHRGVVQAPALHQPNVELNDLLVGPKPCTWRCLVLLSCEEVREVQSRVLGGETDHFW
jgi:hypothetical protein